MPRELSRQEFDAIAARVAQRAPEGLSRQQFDDLVTAEAMKASGYEQPLTRERQSPGAPSALAGGHHPETMAGGRHADALRAIQEAELPSDAAFLKRGPEVGGAAGMMLGGPLGAGVGAGLGRLAKGQHEQGGHAPSAGELAGAAGEGLVTTALGAGPRLAQVGARVAGPAIANNARRIGRAASALPGVGFGAGMVSGNPLMMLGSAAAGVATSPGVIRGAGNLATRIGNSPIVETGADLLGRGARAMYSYRQALLDALGEDPASTVP